MRSTYRPPKKRYVPPVDDEARDYSTRIGGRGRAMASRVSALAKDMWTTRQSVDNRKGAEALYQNYQKWIDARSAAMEKDTVLLEHKQEELENLPAVVELRNAVEEACKGIPVTDWEKRKEAADEARDSLGFSREEAKRATNRRAVLLNDIKRLRALNAQRLECNEYSRKDIEEHNKKYAGQPSFEELKEKAETARQAWRDAVIMFLDRCGEDASGKYAGAYVGGLVEVWKKRKKRGLL